MAFPPRLVAGRYSIEELVGEGGMSTVYRATDQRLRRRVAVKILRRHLVSDERSVARFRQEARAAASLSHPNVVSVFDWGIEGQIQYLVMEFVDGPSLEQLLRERGHLAPEEAARIAADAALGLEAAHERGIVHRDVKPGNILLDLSGRVRVADFGIARVVGATAVTRAGAILGSVPYLSPEQAVGDDVTASSDIYSLGVVLFEMLTGRKPFEGATSAEAAVRRLHVEAPLPSAIDPQVPASIDPIVRRSMDRDPSLRYPSAAAFHADLEEWRRARGGAIDVAGAGMAAAGATGAAGAAQAAAGPRRANEPTDTDVVTESDAPTNVGPARPGAAEVAGLGGVAGVAAPAALAAGAAAPTSAAARGVQSRGIGRPGVAAAVSPGNPARLSGTSPVSSPRGAVNRPAVARGRTASAPAARSRRERRDFGFLVPLGLLAIGLLAWFLVSNALAPGSAPSHEAVGGATAAPAQTPIRPASPANPRTASPTIRPTAPPTPAPTAPPTPAPTPPPSAAPGGATPGVSPSQVVGNFYSLVAAHDFSNAAALWSPSMQQRYPPPQYIDGRFANTTRIVMGLDQTVSQAGGTATVNVNLTEYRNVDPAVQQLSGSWQLVRIGGRWLMNDPSF